MIEQDTIKLYRECDAGIKMGISSIDDVLKYADSKRLSQCLSNCRNEHIKLQDEIQSKLDSYHDDGKDPALIAKGMSWIKTNVKLGLNDSDSTIADLMIDGCDMGVKSLSRYLNQYAAADEHSKDIAKRLIKLEDTLSADMRRFL